MALYQYKFRFYQLAQWLQTKVSKFCGLKRYTILVPVYQACDLSIIDGNTGSIPSPRWLRAKYRNFVVVNKALFEVGGGSSRRNFEICGLKRYTIVVPVFQGCDLCIIDGNTGSIPSPQWFHAKYRNFVVVNTTLFEVGGGSFKFIYKKQG